MKETFYSEKDGFLFWVAGYTRDGNTRYVTQMIESLKEGAQTFADFAGVPIETVMTDFVEKSQRYKFMRVFYVESTEKKAPENAFRLGKDWTMWQWLQY